ncbi:MULTISPECIES: flavodoxin family protein [unclassified Sphingobium]|uniref:flavodoxin family protein n=1 Tax=unclassified Sphingobium TaxID=2611147 RepID=UPI0011994DB0|nr:MULTISPECIES: NAD(P)H-dependent oxidoreductase [unclassified Sphingobium]MBG6120484.1 multimeric flavodoxin WrbA [Sphingobium sp. JAI105]TWC98133.1 multimeric flavodoxin WrbA [Sphingobium sp. AEW010]TWD17882.1 multimeric flavodoxin WrbA [Sphingobium sp. AEW013]TWD20607.1 multimeric flavodoxin WrbA [Sphingobium sp. AEW001]
MTLKALALNCTLKADVQEECSTNAMIAVLAKAFKRHDVSVSETVRVAAFDIKPGVTSDEGDGDAWPALRKKILGHDILIWGGPIWMGQISSTAKRVLERMDAFLSETDDKGRMPSYGKVAVAAIVGNEDGAHFSSAQLFQALNDVGWTIPAVASCYWVGEAMGSVDFKDLDKTPAMVTKTADLVAANAAHLAGLLATSPYPG